MRKCPLCMLTVQLEQDAISVEVFTNTLADAEVVQKLLEKQPPALSI